MFVGIPMQDAPGVKKRIFQPGSIAYMDDDGETLVVYFIGGKKAEFTKRDRATFIAWFNDQTQKSQAQILTPPGIN